VLWQPAKRRAGGAAKQPLRGGEIINPSTQFQAANRDINLIMRIICASKQRDSSHFPPKPSIYQLVIIAGIVKEAAERAKSALRKCLSKRSRLGYTYNSNNYLIKVHC